MNLYEEKFKEAFARAVELRDKRSAAIKERHKEINQAEESIKEISRSINVLRTFDNNDAILVLESKSQELSITINRLYDAIRQEERWLMNDTMRVNFLKEACPHVETEYDHTDYHKNEEFHRCKLCGTVF